MMHDDFQIPTEVVPGDGLYEELVRISARADTLSVLEVGCSDGQGSTAAIVTGFGLRRREYAEPRLYCIDSSRARAAACRERYKKLPNVHVLCGLSCGAGDVASEEEIRAYKGVYSTSLLLTWRAGWDQYIAETKPCVDMIASAITLNGGPFDVVVLDGGEFSARYELDKTYGSRWIVLDDTQSFKNASNYVRLLADRSYTLVSCDPGRRNGWAVFGRKGQI
jgi:SAM-dependent methyltransferase